jgi:hypothetical protein
MGQNRNIAAPTRVHQPQRFIVVVSDRDIPSLLVERPGRDIEQRPEDIRATCVVSQILSSEEVTHGEHMPVSHQIVLVLDLPHKSCAMPERSLIEMLLKRNGCERKLIQANHLLSPVSPVMPPHALS